VEFAAAKWKRREHGGLRHAEFTEGSRGLFASRHCASAALRSASPSGKTRQHWRAAGISGIRAVALRRQCVPPSHRENSPRLEGHGDFRHSRRCASAALRSAFPSGKFSKTGRLRGLQAFAPLSLGGSAFRLPFGKVRQDWKATGTSGIRAVAPRRLCVPPPHQERPANTGGLPEFQAFAPLRLGGNAFRPPIGKIRQDWKATGTSGIRAVAPQRLCVPPSHLESSPRLEGCGDFRHSRR